MARSAPDYDFFPPDGDRSRTGSGRPLERRSKGLSTLAPDAEDTPFPPGGRVSAPPPNVPPVFERPAEPRPDVRPWSVPTQTSRAGGVSVADQEPWYRVPGGADDARPAPRTGGAPEAVPPGPAPASAPSHASPASPTSAAGRAVPAFTAYSGPQHPAPTSTSAPSSATASWTPPAPRPPDVTVGRPAPTRRARAVVSGVLALALVGGAVVAAVVGVPRYVQREDRLVWERTTVRVPRTLAGLPRITTASAAAQAKASQVHLLGSGAGQMISDLAVYGRARGTRVAVVVARPQHPLEGDERDLVRTSFTAAMAAEGVVLTQRDAGPLGGWFGCGVKAGRTTTCLAVDAGAVVSVTVTATGASAVTVAREARAAVEQRP